MPYRDAYRTWVTGRSPLDLDVRTVSADDSRRLEARLIPITLVILVLAFGALVAALLPLLIGFLAVTISVALIGVVAGRMPMSVFVLNLTTMIGLGVGIDYSLLVVTRFREELTRGYRRKEAAARTFRTAGMAVLTSGLTVVVGFGALVLTPLVETKSLGIAGLIVVGVAVLLSTTLLPALLATIGRGIDRPRWLARRLTWYHSPRGWEKWARTLSRHPRRALVLGGTAVAILTAPLFWIRIGLPARHWWPSKTEAGAGVEHAGADRRLGLPVPDPGAGGIPRRAERDRPDRAAGAAAPLRFDAQRSPGARREEPGGPHARAVTPGVLPDLLRSRFGPGQVQRRGRRVSEPGRTDGAGRRHPA